VFVCFRCLLYLLGLALVAAYQEIGWKGDSISAQKPSQEILFCHFCYISMFLNCLLTKNCFTVCWYDMTCPYWKWSSASISPRASHRQICTSVIDSEMTWKGCMMCMMYDVSSVTLNPASILSLKYQSLYQYYISCWRGIVVSSSYTRPLRL